MNKERTERILALLLLANLKGASQQERIAQLSIAGFSNLEIADIIQTTTAVVAQSLYTSRRGKSKKEERKNHTRQKRGSRDS